MFLPFLTAHEGSTACTHAAGCMPPWSAPLKSIHCYSSPPLHVSVSPWAVQCLFWLMVRDALWGTNGMSTWTMNHHGPQHRNTPATAPFTYLPTVIPVFLPLCTCSFLLSVFFFSLFSCPFAHLVALVATSLMRGNPDMFRRLWQWVKEKRGEESLLLPCDHSLKLWIYVWLDGWWQSISS